MDPLTGNPIPARASSPYAGQYARVTDGARLLEIFSESRNLALSSKVPATARGRFDLSVEAYHQLMSLELPEDLQSSIHETMLTLAGRFPIQSCLNEATGLCAQAAKLKTARRRLEYLGRARDVLVARMREETSGLEEIRAVHDRVVAEMKSAESTAGKSSDART